MIKICIMADAKDPWEGKTDEELTKWNMDVYTEMQNVNEDGLTWANKTAMWIAYERQLESERPDALFNDFLAKDFVEPYGKKLSDAFAMGGKHFFDPTGEVGFGFQGFRSYHAARTRFISENIKNWRKVVDERPKQVINLGAGFDTRPYWDESTAGLAKFWQVDTKDVFDFKDKCLAKYKDLESLCPSEQIAMDFSKESTKDLATKGIDFKIPVCWILEGLIMYLSEEVNTQMFTELSDLSESGSYLMVNFINGELHHGAEFVKKTLGEKGWTLEKVVYFGEDDFNFGRYPAGKPANKTAGFCIFTRVF